MMYISDTCSTVTIGEVAERDRWASIMTTVHSALPADILPAEKTGSWYSKNMVSYFPWALNRTCSSRKGKKQLLSV